MLHLVLCLFATSTALAQDDLGIQARDIFVQRCGDCHASTADAVKKERSLKKFSTADRLDLLSQDRKSSEKEPGKLVAANLVDTQDPVKSALLVSCVGEDANMPQDKDGEYVALSQADQQTLQQWFAAKMPLPGVKLVAPVQPIERPTFVDDQVWLGEILNDLDALEKQGKSTHDARYFTLGHLYNAGAGEERLETQRRGLTKLLNSLSWNPKLCQPRFFGSGKALARILLSDLRWDAAKWNQLSAVENNYFVLQDLDEERTIARRTGTNIAWVRADWFVFHAAQPPLYHDLLAPIDAPGALVSDAALEAYLQLDVARNIADYNVARAGFVGGATDRAKGSGVSDNNRLIERHALKGGNGYYWKSYDFGSNAGKKNIFDNPFGPTGIPYAEATLRDKAFERDGGELIWSLPNGMQGYLLVKEDGKRIDDSRNIPNIVGDPAKSAGLGEVIVNGLSCMACHDQGMKDKADQIRQHVEALTPVSFTRGARQSIQKLHPEPAAFTALLQKDGERFQTAAQQLGVKGLDARQREAVVAAFSDFRDTKVSFDQAAFELGLQPAQLGKMLGAEHGSLRHQLEVRGVPRDLFLQSFRTIAAQLGMTLVGSKGKPDVPAPPVGRAALKQGSKLATGIGMTMLYVEPQSFSMGSPSQESGRDDDESQHKVTITKGYWLGETEVTQKQWLEVMGTRPWQGKEYVIEGDEVAASYVSWNDAELFCSKLTERERAAGRLPPGYRYDPPSEAEWELACRAGSKASFSFGDGEGELGSFAVFSGSRSGQYAHGVKSKRANPWGFFDMHGNVWEWCADQVGYESGVVSAVYSEGVVDPLNRSGPRRASRGGGWNNSAASCRSASRNASEPGIASGNLGFRPALAARSDK